jgi:hypothetical protein
MSLEACWESRVRKDEVIIKEPSRATWRTRYSLSSAFLHIMAITEKTTFTLIWEPPRILVLKRDAEWHLLYGKIKHVIMRKPVSQTV